MVGETATALMITLGAALVGVFLVVRLAVRLALRVLFVVALAIAACVLLARVFGGG